MDQYDNADLDDLDDLDAQDGEEGLWDEFSDLATARRRATWARRRRRLPETIRRTVRRATGGRPLAVGEITKVGSEDHALGQLVRRKEDPRFRRGPRALVTYDDRGNVSMRVYSPAMNPTTAPIHIGAVSTDGLPEEPRARGREIERRIRALTSRVTRQTFETKAPGKKDADLIPSGRRAAPSDRGIGRVNYDEFLDLAGLDAELHATEGVDDEQALAFYRRVVVSSRDPIGYRATGPRLSPAAARSLARQWPGVFVQGTAQQAGAFARSIGPILRGPEAHGGGLSHYHVRARDGGDAHIWFARRSPREFFS